MKRLNVAICTYNRAEALRQTLQGLCEQSVHPDTFDVSVIDNASTDNTREVVEAFRAASVPVRYIYEPRQGLSYARNHALEQANAPIIAYLDDDAVPEPQWAKSLLEAYDTVKPMPAIVGGRILLNWQGARPGWIHNDLLWIFAYLNPDRVRIEPINVLFGCNMSFQTDILRKYGGFDTRLGVRARERKFPLLGEETELLDRLRKDGYFLYFHPQATVKHIVGKERATPEYLIRRIYAVGKTEAALRFQYERPRRKVLLSLAAREIYYHRAELSYVCVAALSGKLFKLTSDNVLMRCKIAQIAGYEQQLLKMLLTET